MRNETSVRRWFAVITVCSLWLVPGLHAQGSLNDLIAETQQMTEAPDRVRLVWWIPTQFWEKSMGADPSVTEAQVEEIVSALEPYLMIAAVDAAVGPFGGMDFVAKEELRKQVRVIDGDGAEYEPLATEAVSADVRNLLAMISPIIAGGMGDMGSNMAFLLFPATTASGSRLADPLESGRFFVEVDGERFEFRLPLGSLLPLKICPEDGERLSGAWSYCPWHGNALEPVDGE